MPKGQLSLTNVCHTLRLVMSCRCGFWLSGVLLGFVLLSGCANGPGRDHKRAPVVDMSAGQLSVNPSSTAASAGSYVVKRGDTLLKIAREHRVEVEDIKRWNKLNDVNQLTVGEVLTVAPPASASAPVAHSSSDLHPVSRPLSQKQATVTPRSFTPPSTPPSPRAAEANPQQWSWPAPGQILQPFNTQSKGIDIAGSLGDPVYAAAGGKVLYSGNGVRGLGNLLIISHEGGFISAYAHNRALLVKTGQVVKRGEKIAEVGDTDTTSPRVHFEIRLHGTPVDPMQYLPPR